MKNVFNIARLFFLILSICFVYSCKKDKPPVLSTLQVSDIRTTTATGGGKIISDGGSDIMGYGIVWSTSMNPTISDNQMTAEGTISGDFSFNMEGLTANTLYHVRAYAANSIGTTYGQDIVFTTDPLFVSDVEGNVYNLVRIGDQLWMKENLKTSTYRNGDLIGTTSTPLTDVTGETEPKYQWAYDGNEDNVEINGRLYTWFAATDTRGVCPTGWHLPSDEEWTTLTDYLINNGYGFGGSGNDIAKSMASTSGWSVSDDAGTIGYNPESNNSSGFAGAPSGARATYLDGGSVVVYFGMLNTSCAWWTSSELDNSLAWQRILQLNNPEVHISYYGTKKTGASVRCIRDN